MVETLSAEDFARIMLPPQTPLERRQEVADQVRERDQAMRKAARRDGVELGLEAANDRLEAKAYFDGKRPFANQRAAFVRGIEWSKEEIGYIDPDDVLANWEHDRYGIAGPAILEYEDDDGVRHIKNVELVEVSRRIVRGRIVEEEDP